MKRVHRLDFVPVDGDLVPTTKLDHHLADEDRLLLEHRVGKDSSFLE
jgi:hypothetical protein